ncbi:hypothetical protein ACFL21_04760 [Patescibacteria group bacterium]
MSLKLVNSKPLINLETRPISHHGKHGEKGRSTHAYRCEDCNTSTNAFVYKYYPHAGRRIEISCEGTKFSEHEQLAEILKQRIALISKIELYESAVKDPDFDGHSHESSDFLVSLRTERHILTFLISKLRQQFAAVISDDIEGLDPEDEFEVLPLKPTNEHSGDRSLADEIERLNAETQNVE